MLGLQECTISLDFRSLFVFVFVFFVLVIVPRDNLFVYYVILSLCLYYIDADFCAGREYSADWTLVLLL